MTRIDAHALVAYVGGLETAAARIDELAETMPRAFVRAEHHDTMRAATDSFLSAAREGAEQLRDTPYGAVASTALADATHAVEFLGRPSRGQSRTLGESLHRVIATLDSELTTARRADWDSRIMAGGESLQGARQELVAAIDTLVGSDTVDRASAAVVTDALASGSYRIPKPTLEVSRPLDELLAAAGDDRRAAYDLDRVLGSWRSQLDESFEAGPKLAARAQELVARGADDLTPADWRELQRLVDADPAGAFVRHSNMVHGAWKHFDEVAFAATQREPGTAATWGEHVLVESTALSLSRADSDLGVLAREARTLLKRDPETFGDREWARLAEMARMDTRYRVLPHQRSETSRDALLDVVSLTRGLRTEHPHALTPSARYYTDHDARTLALHWRDHVTGLGSRLRLEVADHGVNGLVRGIGRLESGLGEAIETGLADDATGGQVALHLVGRLGTSIGRGIGKGVRDGVGAILAPKLTGESLARALDGGPVPERISIGTLRRMPEWREASHTAQVSLLTRMLARQVPNSMPTSRKFIQDMRRLSIDESALSAGTRSLWREARAMADREYDAMRLTGEYRQGYGGHADYANLGRLRSMLDAVGGELALRAKVESATYARANTPTTTAATVAPELTPEAGAARNVNLDAAAGLDERLVW